VATPGLSVWVVDDDESVRWVLEQALKQAHMIPRAFDTGRSFFSALERDRPDVLVTDIRMPDMSGLELMERLTQTDPDIPVIVITAHYDHLGMRDPQPGEPLLFPVMRGGRRLAATPLADIRSRAEAGLAQLPEALRRLDEPHEYPVEVANALQELARQVDVGQTQAAGDQAN